MVCPHKGVPCDRKREGGPSLCPTTSGLGARSHGGQANGTPEMFPPYSPDPGNTFPGTAKGQCLCDYRWPCWIAGVLTREEPFPDAVRGRGDAGGRVREWGTWALKAVQVGRVRSQGGFWKPCLPRRVPGARLVGPGLRASLRAGHCNNWSGCFLLVVSACVWLRLLSKTLGSPCLCSEPASRQSADQ